MSKGNLFLGLATGKIGSVVLYRAFGEERARSWLATKRNPRTWRQAVQRAAMKTAQVAYSSLITLCRESFQGAEPGTPCQSAFVSRNLAILRGRIADDIAAGRQAVLESTVGNYNGIAAELPLYNRLMVSDGGLSPIPVSITGGGISLSVPGASAATTYADVCSALGCGAGDTLDLLFAAVGADTGVLSSIEHCRVVLRPSGGDMTAPFIADAAVNQPNAGNFGRLSVSVPEEAGVLLLTVPFAASAGAVVRSRWYGDLHQFSPAYLEVSGSPSFADAAPLGAAVASYMSSSNIYLNGAL